MPDSSVKNNCFILQNLDLLVVSFGGVGTSFFMKFFDQHKLINQPNNMDGCKHLVQPPLVLKPGLKVIYIFGDPVEAAVSLFRRGYHYAHALKLSPDKAAVKNLMSQQTTIEEYMRQGQDFFCFENHYKQWSTAETHYPILFINYSYIWDYLGEIFEFIGLPQSLITEFPAKRDRQSKLADLDQETKDKLQDMYGEFQAFLQAEPKFRIREGNAKTYFSQLSKLPAAIQGSDQPIFWRLILSSYLKKQNF